MKNIFQLLDLYKESKYLKHRSKEYILRNIRNFYCCYIGGILEGCSEFITGENYLELACFVVKPMSKVKESVSKILIATAKLEADKINMPLISLTNNRSLEQIYAGEGFHKTIGGEFTKRALVSPGVNLYVHE